MDINLPKMRKLSAILLMAIALSFTTAPLVFAQDSSKKDVSSAAAQAQESKVNSPDKNIEDVATSTTVQSDQSSPLLKPEPGMIIWTLIVFILLLIVLGKWVWPVILKALKDREAKLTNDFKDAQTARQEAQKTLAEYKQQLSDAQREAQEIIKKSREDARKLSEQLKEKTQHDLTQMHERMESDIEAAKQRAISEVHEQTAIVATKIATRILRREIEESDQQNLVNYSMQEFGRLTNNEDKQASNNN